MDYKRVLVAINSLIPLLKADIEANEPKGIVAVNMADALKEDMGWRSERRACYDFLEILAKDVLIGLETAMYVGRELFEGDTISKDNVRNLDKMREQLCIVDDNYCADQIISKKSSALLKYFEAYVNAAL